jgi:HAD superfamily hydrolase (TIGR01459 family)
VTVYLDRRRAISYGGSMTNTATPAMASGLAELAPTYRSLLCDIWGIVHDGVTAHARAGEALVRYRREGGRVVLITNAPRPKADVVQQLDRLGVPRAAYDDIVTSGESARHVLAARPGIRIHHVGPERDLPIYFGLQLEFGDEDDCEMISCTGLFDDEGETPDDYLESMRDWQERGVPMLCVNPDIVVERGNRLVWCAGALAERYREMNGQTIVVGKPYAPIYETALARLAELGGKPLDKGSLLAVGDGIDTDVRGAVGQGIDVLFATGGIHAGVFGPREAPDLAEVHAFLATAGLGARALVTQLTW